MSTWTEVVTYIKTQLRPGVLGNTNVQKILNSVLAVIQQINAGDYTPSSDFVWNPESSYSATIQPVLWQDQWLVSNIGDNLGNVPISTSGVLHPSWRIIGSSAGSGIRIWEAIVYPNSLELVYESGQLYYLNRSEVGLDPFVSIDFSVELSEGKWVAFLEIMDHNQLEGIQGGIEGERYHLTLAEKNSIGAGGNNPNAVHYNVADGKNATERQQARSNLFLETGLPQVHVIVGTNVSIPTRTSNSIVITDGTATFNLVAMQAGLDTEAVTIYNRTIYNCQVNNESGPIAYDRFSIGSTLVILPGGSFRVIYDASISRWIFDNALLRDGDTTKRGNINMFGNINFPSGSNPGARQFFLNSSGSISFRIAFKGAEFFQATTNGIFSTRSYDIYVGGDLGAGGPTGLVRVFRAGTDGKVFHSRSSDGTESIRRDEQRLFYVRTITTVGTINSLVLQNGIFNYRFTSATSITGFNPDDIGQSIIIQNASSGTLTLVHESSLSIGGMRIRIIGGSDLVIPIEGKVTLIYVTENRWELLCKNF
jgi:hypothetical protein